MISEGIVRLKLRIARAVRYHFVASMKVASAVGYEGAIEVLERISRSYAVEEMRALGNRDQSSARR
jgi:hypothetical protein